MKSEIVNIDNKVHIYNTTLIRCIVIVSSAMDNSSSRGDDTSVQLYH